MEWDLELGGAEAAAIALAVLFGALLVIVCFWNRSPQRRQSQMSDAETAEMHAAMVRLHGELPELFHDLSCQLDTKMQALRSLIREAAASIETLRAAGSQADFAMEGSERVSEPSTPHASIAPESQSVRTMPAANAESAEPIENQLIELCEPDAA